MAAQENVQLIEDLYRTFLRGEIAGVLNVIHQDADLDFEGPTSITWAGNWRGRDGWLSFFQPSATTLMRSLCRWSRSRLTAIA